MFFLLLSSCVAHSPTSVSSPSAATSRSAPLVSPGSPEEKLLETPTATASTSKSAPQPAISPDLNLTSVSIYTIDAQCNQLVPVSVTVPEKRSLEAAVGQVLDRQSSTDFQLVGYRVQRTPGSPEVTIDLRRSPSAQRGFVSLSTCEQLALFGGLRQTLTSNPIWGISTVIFTENGKRIDIF